MPQPINHTNKQMRLNYREHLRVTTALKYIIQFVAWIRTEIDQSQTKDQKEIIQNKQVIL